MGSRGRQKEAQRRRRRLAGRPVGIGILLIVLAALVVARQLGVLPKPVAAIVREIGREILGGPPGTRTPQTAPDMTVDIAVNPVAFGGPTDMRRIQFSAGCRGRRIGIFLVPVFLLSLVGLFIFLPLSPLLRLRVDHVHDATDQDLQHVEETRILDDVASVSTIGRFEFERLPELLRRREFPSGGASLITTLPATR